MGSHLLGSIVQDAKESVDHAGGGRRESKGKGRLGGIDAEGGGESQVGEGALDRL